MKRRNPLLSVVAALMFCPLALAQSPRITPTVKLIQKVESAVVAVFHRGDNGAENHGSGTIIHEDGFILTNDHVVRDQPGLVLLADGTVTPYKTIGRLPEKDLALLKIAGQQPFVRVPLGRSHDVLAGEPVLAGGNPGGRGIVFTSGIVNSPAMMLDAPSAVAMSFFRGDVRDRFIQFDATVNPGNSGGPLVNAEGRQIGIVSAKNLKEQNINFAIPIDRVRRYFAEMAAVEESSGVWLGVEVDLLAERAVVTAVAQGSPAATSGIKAGDVLTTANGKPLRSGIDWVLASVGTNVGQSITTALERDGAPLARTLKAAAYPMAAVASEEGKKPGLRYSLYRKKLSKLDELKGLKPAGTGVSPKLETDDLAGSSTDDFAIVYEGFLKIEQTGLHRLVLASDDGSRLYLDGRLLIDNDGPHPPVELGRNARLAAGLHAIRIEFFEATGGAELKLSIQPPGGERHEAAATAFFHE
jgi:S1-C subfamily serine protease